MRHFQAKISKIFWGGGTAPSPDPAPTGEGNTPDQTPHPRRAALDPLSEILNTPLELTISLLHRFCIFRFSIFQLLKFGPSFSVNPWR